MFRFLKFLFHYKFTLLCVLYFLSICIMFSHNGFLRANFISIPSALTLILILIILSKTKYTQVLTVILSFIIAFDAYFAYFFHNPLLMGSMASIWETNAREASGALENALFPAILLFSATLLLVFLAQKELKHIKISRKTTLLILFIYLGIFIPIVFTFVIKTMKGFGEEFKNKPLLVTQRITSSCMPLMYNDFITVVAYHYEMWQFKNYKNDQRVLPEGIHLQTKKETPNKIFLVLGESSWQEHYSLYEYKISTTPFLDSLHHDKSVDFNYYNGISAAPITREAIRLSLSFSTPFAREPYFKEKNIIELANDAGYETIWISNQNKMGLYDSYVGYISSTAQSNYFPENDTFTSNDFDLINIVKSKYKTDKKQFFVIHLLGSHMPYEGMLDKIDKQGIPGDDNDVVVNYDRSIHHTDRMIQKIYQTVQQDKSYFILYFSDHGENIGLGHGFMGYGAHQFEIPYVTINKSTDPADSIVSQYIDKETRLLNSSNTVYILTEVLGYSVPEKSIKHAVSDGKYILHADLNPYLYKDIQKENK